MEDSSTLSALTRVAWMYYVQQMTHEDIAKQLKVSRPTVTRMLMKARDVGIVEINVKGAYRSCIEIGEKIREKTKIQDVLVIPSGKDIFESRDGVGRTAAEYLNDHLKSGDVLGLSWGKTLGCVVPYLKPFKDNNLTTVQLMGGINTSSLINPQQILTNIAKALGAYGMTNSVPAVVDNKQIKESIMRDGSVCAVFEKARAATIALLGIGDMTDASSLKQIGAVSEEEFEDLKMIGAVGDVLAWFFDRSGKRIETVLNERVMSVDQNVVKKVPLKIGMTAGKYKCDAVIGALNGGWVNVLIIDEDLANEVYLNL